MITQFFFVFKDYLIEILPALAIGFFLSGLINEFISTSWVEKYLGERGIKPILYATITGTVLPVCCWGSLPIAISFYKKGARLGPVLAFLVATPATSVSALIVAYKLLGLRFTIYIFFAVILMGLIIGGIGNLLKFKPRIKKGETCPHCAEEMETCICGEGILAHIKSIFKFAFWDMPREIGLEIFIGIILAASVAAFVPVGRLIKAYLAGGWGYSFSLIFGLIMYICSTATVPLVHAFIKQGMNIGAGMVLLLVGPVTSYGTVLVLRKEFGVKILLVYLGVISIFSLILGYTFSLIY